MTLRAPGPLAAQHLLEGFDYGKPALNDWLLRHARQAQGSGSAKTFVVAEDLATPWKRENTSAKKLAGPMPKSLTVTLANLIYFEKAELPQALANRLIRLAAFQNPEFYKAQATRMSVWDKPRVIGCAESYPQHIALPRGCLDAALSLLRENGIACDLRDERFGGQPLDVSFVGSLRLDQEAAVAGLLTHDAGVLCAPTAFGKTVTAAAMIARRGVNTLVLVHRTELLKQWQERLQAFLGGANKGVVGTIGGGKAKPTGKIDIAVMQSLSRQGEVNPLVEDYGQVIVDECHHVGAVSFDAILKWTKAKYLLGLTATPIRRDGQQPIIFLQCGPIRHTAATPAGAPHDLAVIPHSRHARIDLPTEAGIQDVFRHLANDPARTAAIAAEVRDAVAQGRKVLVLTERTEHLDAIKTELDSLQPAPFVLHGRMSRTQRAALVADLDTLPPDAPRVLLSTGKLVGEGFDHPPLDTLILAMPVSWKGTLQQYAGRLHREHASKDRRADHRLRRHRPSSPAADVGQAATGLPGDGVSHRGGARTWRNQRNLFRDNGLPVIPRGEMSEIRCQHWHLSSVCAIVATNNAISATILPSDRSWMVPMSERINARLSQPLAEFVDRMVGEAGLYETPSEYVRDLIRRDMERRDGQFVQEAILAGYRDLAAGRVFSSSGDFKADMAVLDRKEADGWK